MYVAEVSGMGMVEPNDLLREPRYPLKFLRALTSFSREHGRASRPTLLTWSERKLFTLVRDEEDGHLSASFLDLVQLQFVAVARQYKVEIQRIRRFLDERRERGQTHPLAHADVRDLYVIGGDLVLIHDDPHGTGVATSVTHEGQRHFREMVQLLGHRLDFSTAGDATIWYPLGREGLIEVDPARRWGEPVIAGTRVPTWVVRGYDARGELAEVPRNYNVTYAEALAAAKFESLLGNAA